MDFKMTIQDIKAKNLILFEAISGSRSFGLATENSDTDIRGVYYLPKEDFFGLNYIPQISNETNDITYYEIGRFVELLQKKQSQYSGSSGKSGRLYLAETSVDGFLETRRFPFQTMQRHLCRLRRFPDQKSKRTQQKNIEPDG